MDAHSSWIFFPFLVVRPVPRPSWIPHPPLYRLFFTRFFFRHPLLGIAWPLHPFPEGPGGMWTLPLGRFPPYWAERFLLLFPSPNALSFHSLLPTKKTWRFFLFFAGYPPFFPFAPMQLDGGSFSRTVHRSGDGLCPFDPGVLFDLVLYVAPSPVLFFCG